MAGSAKLLVEILVKSNDAAKGFDKAKSSSEKWQSGLQTASVAAGAALVAMGAFAKQAVDSASRTQQAFGGLDAVFGSNSAQVKDWANSAADSMGLSASAYAEGAAKIGAQMKNLGVPMDEVAGKTDGLMRMAADLAATYGGTTAEAVDALSAALRGEADPAERYGLALSQTAINAQMAAEHTDKLTGKAKNQAKVNTILAMATEQSAGALGQFARESDTAAGSAEIAAANWENAKSTLGEVLLPVVTAVAQAIASFAKVVMQHQTAFKVLAAVIIILAGAIMVASAAIWVMNAALLANPITWIVLAVVALIAVFVALVVVVVMLWKKFQTWSKLVAIFNAVKAGVMAAVGGIVAAWQKVVAVFNIVKTAIMSVVSVVVGAFVGAWQAVANFVGGVINSIKGFLTALGVFIIGVAQRMLAPFVPVFKLIQALGTLAFVAIRLALQVLLAVATFVAGLIKAVFVAAWNAIKATASAAFNFIRAKLQPLIAVGTAVANAIRNAFTAAWNLIKSTASAAAAFVRARWQSIAGPIMGIINSIRSAFASAWNSIKSAASSAASYVRGRFAAIAGPITDVAHRIESAFSSALSRLKGAASGLTGALTAPFHAIAGAINSAISAVNNLINRLSSIHVPKISIPKGLSASASSAAVRTPSVGLRSVGEPLLARRTSGVSTASSSAGAVVINVNGALDPDAVARQIERILGSAQRRRQGVLLRQRAAGATA